MTRPWWLTAGACQYQLKKRILHFVFSLVSMCNAEGAEGRSIAENLQYAEADPGLLVVECRGADGRRLSVLQ